MNPNGIGERSEAMVLAALLRAGALVLIAPFSDNQRYDFVIDKGDRFLRVQVKTGRLQRDGVIAFPTASPQAHRGRGKQPYKGQVDYFAVYRPALGRVYWVPVDQSGISQCKLRVGPTRNGQSTGVRWAEHDEVIP